MSLEQGRQRGISSYAKSSCVYCLENCVENGSEATSGKRGVHASHEFTLPALGNLFSFKGFWFCFCGDFRWNNYELEDMDLGCATVNLGHTQTSQIPSYHIWKIMMRRNLLNTDSMVDTYDFIQALQQPLGGRSALPLPPLTQEDTEAHIEKLAQVTQLINWETRIWTLIL